jgi:hypothetical protein
MNAGEQLPLAVGKIVMNLQTFEFSLRLFLHESVGTPDRSFSFEGLAVDEMVVENALTNYDSLADLIGKTNRRLKELGISERIDSSLVGVRDSIAHGRVMALHPTGPFRLLKFSRPRAGKVQVRTAVELTKEWLAQQIERTREETIKVFRLARSLGLSCFPPCLS